MFLRQQCTCLEMDFGTIKADIEHHVAVLQLAKQAQQLSQSRAAEAKQEKKEREELLD